VPEFPDNYNRHRFTLYLSGKALNALFNRQRQERIDGVNAKYGEVVESLLLRKSIRAIRRCIRFDKKRGKKEEDRKLRAQLEELREKNSVKLKVFDLDKGEEITPAREEEAAVELPRRRWFEPVEETRQEAVRDAGSS